MTTLKSNFVKASLGLVAGASMLLTAGSALAADTFTRNLTVGSRGADVTALQAAVGVSPTTGYFGNITKAAVKAYQTANKISPVSGYVGPLTRSILNAGGTTTTTGSFAPAGCTSASGFSPVTGGACYAVGTTIPQTGPVTAALATDNPAAGTVLTGQATADMLHFTLNGSGTVTSVTLQRTGLSANTDLSAVYLYNGATRLTDAASVNSSGVITFSGMNLAVNGMMTVSVRADILSGSTSYSVGVTMTGFTAGGTANTVNIAGNQMYIGSSSGILGTVTMNMSNLSTSTASVNAGATNYTLWTTSLQTNTHAMTLHGASLQFVGSAPTNSLANLSLYVDGVKVGTSTGVNAYNYVVFDLSGAPKVLATGAHTVDVRADMVNGANRTVQLVLQNAGDFMISDNNVVGVNIAPTAAGTTQTAFPLKGNTVTINAGTFSPVIAPSFTTMTTVTGGATNAPIARWNVNAYGEDVKVTSIVLTPTVASGIVSSGSSTNVNNVQLYFNGSQVGSTCQYTGTACTFTLGSSLIIPAGTTASTIEVRADMQNNGGYNYTGGTITVSNGSITAQGVYSYNSITSPVLPTTSGLTISTGTLAVGKNAAYANQTLNPNTAGAKIASFTVQNQSSSESVRVTNLAVALTSDGSTAATSGLLNNLSNLVTSETSGSGATPTNAQATNNFSVDFTIAPGATKTIDILASLGTWSAGTYYVTLLPTAYGASSNVTLTPSSATVGQAISLSAGTFGTPTFLSSSSTTTQYVAANGGNVDGTKATFKFTATNGAATISELKFSVTGAGTVSSLRLGGATASVQLTPATTSTAAIVTAGTTLSLTSVSGLSVGSVVTVDSEQMLITAISSLDATVTRAINSTTAVWHASGSTVTPNGIAYFSGLNLAVPNGGSGLSIDVYPTYSSVGTNGVTSGTSSSIQLSYEKYTIGGTTTGTAVTPTSIASPTMVVVGSKPVVAVLATPTNRLSAGTIEAIDVTVAADAKGDITLNSLPITVTLNAATMITAATIVVKDAGGNTLTTTNTVDPFDGYLGGTSTINFTSGYLIQAGTTATFRIYVPVAAVTGTGVNGASMATSLATATFGWTDTAGGGSATMGTTYMYNYPSTSTAVIYN